MGLRLCAGIQGVVGHTRIVWGPGDPVAAISSNNSALVLESEIMSECAFSPTGDEQTREDRKRRDLCLGNAWQQPGDVAR